MYYRGTETRELRLEGSFIRSNNHSVLAKKKHVSFSRGVQESREIDRLHLSSPLNAAAPLLSVKMGYLRSTPLFFLCFLKHGRGRGTGRLSSNNRSPKSALPAGKKCCVSFSILQYRFYPSKSTEQPLLPQPPQSRQTTCYHLWRWPSLPPSLPPTCPLAPRVERALPRPRHFFAPFSRAAIAAISSWRTDGRTNCTRRRQPRR